MNNTSAITSNELVPWEAASWLRTSVAIYLIIIHVVGVPANIITAIIYGRTVPKTACDWLIFTMSITDAFVCFCSPLLYLRAYLRISLPWRKSILCSLEYWLQLTAMIASCALLVTIALDRYVKICRPNLFSLTALMARNLCIICLIISAVVCTYPFLFLMESSQCYVSELRYAKENKVFFTFLLCGFIVSFVIVTFAYASICKQISEKIKLKQRLIEDNGLRSPTKYRNKQETDDNVEKTVEIKNMGEELAKNAERKNIREINDSLADEETVLLNLKSQTNLQDGEIDKDVINIYGNNYSENVTRRKDRNAGRHCEDSLSSHNILTCDLCPKEEHGDTIVANYIQNGASGFLTSEQQTIFRQDFLASSSRTNACELKTCFINTEVPLRSYVPNSINLISPDNTERTNNLQDTPAQILPSERTNNLQDTPAQTLPSERTNNLQDTPAQILPSERTNNLQDTPAQTLLCDSDFPWCQKFESIKMGSYKNKVKLQHKSITLPFDREVIKEGNSVSGSFKEKKPTTERSLSSIHLSPGTLLFKTKSTTKNKFFSCPDLFLAECSMSEHPVCCSIDGEVCSRVHKIPHSQVNKDASVHTKLNVDLEFEASNYGFLIVSATPMGRETLCSGPETLCSASGTGHPSVSGQRALKSVISYNEKRTGTSSHQDQHERLIKSNEYLATNQGDELVYDVTHQVKSDLSTLEHLLPATNEMSASCIHNPHKEIFLTKDTKHSYGCLQNGSISNTAKETTCVGLARRTIISSSLEQANSNHAHTSSEAVPWTHSSTTADISRQQFHPTQVKVKNLETPALPGSMLQNVLRTTASDSSLGPNKTTIFLEMPQTRVLADNKSTADDDDKVYKGMPAELFYSKCRTQADKSGCKISGNLEDSFGPSGIRKRFARERQMTFMLLSVTAAFLLSWIPPWIIYLVFLYGPLEYSRFAVLHYLCTIHLLNYVTSPIINYVFNLTFRSKVKKLLTPHWGWRYCSCRLRKSGATI